VASALEGFLNEECDDELAGNLRAEVEAAQGTGYDHFEFNLFDLELIYGEGRAKIVEAVPLGYEDADLTLTEFLAALPDVPRGARMPRPRKAQVQLPPPD
jgi:hypothetical protein